MSMRAIEVAICRKGERRRSSLMLGAVVVLCACGTKINEVPLNSPPGPMAPRDPQRVEVFTSQKPTRAFAEVAMLEAQQQSVYSTDDAGAIMGKLRAYAAQKGCDGIIMGGANDSTVGSVSNGQGSVSTLKGYRATCIVYTDAKAP